MSDSELSDESFSWQDLQPERASKSGEQARELLCKILAGKIDAAAEERLADYVSKEQSDPLTKCEVQGSEQHLATGEYVELVFELFHGYCTRACFAQYISNFTEDALATMKKDVKGLRKTTGALLSVIKKAHDDSQEHCERIASSETLYFFPDDPISTEEVEYVERVIGKLVRWRIYDHIASKFDGEILAYDRYDRDGFPILLGQAQKQTGPGRPPNTQHNRLVVQLGAILSCTTLKRAEMARCIEKILRFYELNVQSWKGIEQVLLKADLPSKHNKGTACIPSNED